MFAYCLNNPVNYSDPTGKFSNILDHNMAKDGGLHAGGGGGPIIVPGHLFEELVAFLSDVFVTKSVAAKEDEKANVYIDAKTGQRKQYQYWEADRSGKSIVTGKGLSFIEASARVAYGANIICANQGAAKWILVVNCYWNAVGPERGRGDGFLYHYHPHRNTNVHIGFYGGIDS